MSALAEDVGGECGIAMGYAQHWDEIYSGKGPEYVSWYQKQPSLSLELIGNTGIAKDAAIIDVGGGASRLVDFLLDEGYSDLAVLDWSAVTLEQSRRRFGQKADMVQWFHSDIRGFEPPRRSPCGTTGHCSIF